MVISRVSELDIFFKQEDFLLRWHLMIDGSRTRLLTQIEVLVGFLWLTTKLFVSLRILEESKAH